MTLAVLWSLLSLSSSCVSFRTATSMPKEPILEKIDFCSAVKEGPDILKAAESIDAFDSDDQRIYCLIKVWIVPGPMTLRWKWYSPERTLWRDTGEVEVALEPKPVSSITAYDRVPTGPGTLAKGTWTVVIFLNGHFAGRRSFQLM